MKIFLSVFFLFVFSVFASASEPSIWTVSSRAEVLKGEARSVSIDSNGAISLAPRLAELFKTEQPYIWSSAYDAAGNVYLGTGGDGKVFRVAQGGSGLLFADLAELNVTAVAVAQNGRSEERRVGEGCRTQRSTETDVKQDARSVTTI